jgi:hypothetical protein|tara:strand:- start:560 stop:733 length:174 start_codon:yes stop_codon:yes gene_type:complete
MKTYIVEFTHIDGNVEEVELTTDRLEWSIQQWKRNRAIIKHEILEEGSTNSKNMLFG